MQPKSKAITATAAGTALGVAGLAVMALPSAAGEAPALPPISPEELVQSVATTQAPALAGTVEVDNQLGLPAALPGAHMLNLDSAQVYHDGTGKSRLALTRGGSEQTIVHDGATVWEYTSNDNSVTRYDVPQRPGQHPAKPGMTADPAAATTEILNKMRESSTVTVDGTARVADRAAYEMVLTPKPTEQTLVREVRIAVDAEKRVPLELTVLTEGANEPALRIGFSDISFDRPSADLFTFTPPTGAKVTEGQHGSRPEAGEPTAAPRVQPVGDGWDTVVTGQLPAEALAPQEPTSRRSEQGGEAVDPKALLAQLGKPVTGAFGSGHVITTEVVTVLVTSDNRFAAGAVPEQVLFEALGRK